MFNQLGSGSSMPPEVAAAAVQPQPPAAATVTSLSNGCPMMTMLSEQDQNFRKFHILDETEENFSDSSTEKSLSYDSDLPDEEIERMLENAFVNNKRKRTASEAGFLGGDGEKRPFEEKDKVVLIEKTQNHFDVLPEGWIQVTHNSGMPLYLHKTSRVCTLAKPYFLGPGSMRKHEIPLSAIPCLSYRRAIDLETDPAVVAAAAAASANSANPQLPNARIETVKENIKSHNLKPEDIRDYAARLFQFKTIKVLRFKSWSERRQFTKKRKHEKQLQRPNLPDDTKLITFPIYNNVENSVSVGGGDATSSNGTNAAPATNMRREWIMNPNGKSYVCILHEYVQHALKKQPTYKFTELENAGTPYAATVSINDMQYGVGYGTSKKQAKSEAARTTLEILIPEMKSKITADAKTGSSASKDQDQDLSFFDEIRIEDPRVAEFCAKTTEPSPHYILLTCLQRNFGLNELQISYQGNTLKNKKNQFTMTVGKHSATVVCKNKRDGKQRASQAILQALHPHITSWGSLLRLYGNRSVKSFKKKKLEEQEITLLQSKAAVNSPNFAILNKLQLELGKLSARRQEIKPIGVLIPHESDQLPKLSSSNLKNVDL